MLAPFGGSEVTLLKNPYFKYWLLEKFGSSVQLAYGLVKQEKELYCASVGVLAVKVAGIRKPSSNVGSGVPRHRSS